MNDFLDTATRWVQQPENQTYLIIAGVGLVALLALVTLLKSFSRKRTSTEGELPTINLASFPPAPPVQGNQTWLSVYGLPARLRIIVAAPLGREAGNITEEEMPGIVDSAITHLSSQIAIDDPLLLRWPIQYSTMGFEAVFRRSIQLPPGEKDARKSTWVLLFGKVVYNERPMALGLVLQAIDSNSIGMVPIQFQHQWHAVIRLEG